MSHGGLKDTATEPVSRIHNKEQSRPGCRYLAVCGSIEVRPPTRHRGEAKRRRAASIARVGRRPVCARRSACFARGPRTSVGFMQRGGSIIAFGKAAVGEARPERVSDRDIPLEERSRRRRLRPYDVASGRGLACTAGQLGQGGFKIRAGRLARLSDGRDAALSRLFVPRGQTGTGFVMNTGGGRASAVRATPGRGW